jgi:hypothetical protein
MPIAAPYTGTGVSTGQTPAGGNPYQLDPATAQLLEQIQGVGGSLSQGVGAQSQQANMQRQAPSPGVAYANPQAAQLLLAIMQMRAQEASALGAPYGQGTAQQPQRYSLLG